MQKTISELNKNKSKDEEELKLLIETSNVSREAIKWYKEIIKELKDNGIPIDNIKFFIQCLKGIKKEGYEVNKIITKYSESIYLNESIKLQESTKNQIVQEINNLENYKKSLQEQINWDRLKMSKIQELESMGFGYKEFKTIYNTIIEIAKGNNIILLEAIEKFFNDFNDYDNIIDFKKKMEDLRQEVSNLNIQIANNRITLSSQQHIGPILKEILQMGMSEKDIEDINSILSMGKFDHYDTDINNTIIDKSSLISELNKYRNIKLVIKSLKQKQIQLTNNITELENQKATLQNYINHTFMIFSNLKDIQILLKKANIALEYPKIILIYLSSNSFKDGNNKKDSDL